MRISCVASVSCLSPDQYRINMAVVLRDNPTKMGFRDLFGCALGVEGSAQLLA